MTVYVTDARPSGNGSVLRWGRLFADTDQELTLVATELEIKDGMRFPATPDQDSYYVITGAERSAALDAGAKAVRSMPAKAVPAQTCDDLFTDAGRRQ